MNIVIDATTTQDELKNNGVGVYTKPIIEHLIKGYPNTKFKLLMFDSSSTLDPFLANNYANVERVSMGIFRSNNFLNPVWFRLYFLPKIKGIMDKDSIYFCPYFWRGFPINIMPLAVTIHDLTLVKFNSYSHQSPIHNLIRKIEYWYDFKRTSNADAIVTNSMNTTKDFLSYSPKYSKDKVHTIYLGIDMELTEVNVDHHLPKDWGEKGYFIYMGGGFTRNKNSRGVILSYAEFVKMYKKEDREIPYLVITGKSFANKEINEVKELHKIIKENDIEQYVIFTGFYEDSERYSLLKNSIGSLHLSLYEGFGFGLVEGMLAGTPSIAHNGSSYPEVVKDGAILVDGNNYVKVANAMRRIIEDKEYADTLKRKGQKVASTYKWEKTAAQTYEVFKKVSELNRI